MPEIQGLEFTLSSSTDQAIQRIEALAAKLMFLKEATKGGPHLSSFSTGITKLSESLAQFDYLRFNRFSALMSKIGNVNPKISKSFIDNLGLLAGSLKYLNMGDLEKLDTLAAKLKEFEAFGSTIRIPKLKVDGATASAEGALAEGQNELTNVPDPFVEQSESGNRFTGILDRIRAKISELRGEEEQLSTVDAFLKGKSEADVFAMKLDAAKAKLRELLENSDGSYQSQTAIANVTSQIMSLQARLNSFGTSQTGGGLTSFLSRIPTNVHELRSAVMKALGPLGSFISLFHNLTGGGIAGRVGGVLKGITGKITGFFNSLKRIAFYRLIRSLMKALTQGFQEGLKNLYAYSQTVGTDFAGSMDRLATSANYLKNSLAAMASPFINAIAPAIDFVADKIVALFNLINQFISRLTGKTTYTAAKKVATTWQDATGRAVGGARDQVDEFRRYVLGFDELNILGKTSSSNGGGGGAGGAGGLSGADMFEEREIEGSVSRFADTIKKAFLNQDWQTLGTTIGEAINDLVENRIPWAAAGKKFGKAVNGIFSTAYWTLDTINFVSIGNGAAEFLNNAMEQTDFTKIGGTIALAIGGAVDTVGGLLGGLNWNGVGKAVSDSLSGFFDTTTNWMDKHDWEGVGKSIVNSAADFFEGSDGASIAKSIAKSIGTVLRSVFNLLKGMITEAIQGRANAFIEIYQNNGGNFLAALREYMFGENGLRGAGDWLNSNVFSPFGQGLTGNSNYDYVKWTQGVYNSVASTSDILKGLEVGSAKNVGRNVNGSNRNRRRNRTNPVTVPLRLSKDGWTSLDSYVGKLDEQPVELERGNFESLDDFVGRLDPRRVRLEKDNWSTIDKYVGELSPKRFALGKNGWSTLDKYVGEVSTRKFSLGKNGWSTLDKYVGNISTRNFALGKSGWSTLDKYVGTISAKPLSLYKSGWNSLYDYTGTKVDVGVQLYKSGWRDFKSFVGLGSGGIVTKNGAVKFFKEGGWINSLGNFGRFASGTLNAGSAFIAGEAGPELVGHINGRSEVLNASQLADVMYRSTVEGMNSFAREIAASVAGQVISASSGNNQPVVCEVYLDRDRIATAVSRGQQAQNRRYSSTAMN